MASHGLGLQNIKSRVEVLNAEMDVKSDQNGTTVNVDISLPKQSKS
jgi:signal transduction histidine kinase